MFEVEYIEDWGVECTEAVMMLEVHSHLVKGHDLEHLSVSVRFVTTVAQVIAVVINLLEVFDDEKPLHCACSFFKLDELANFESVIMKLLNDCEVTIAVVDDNFGVRKELHKLYFRVIRAYFHQVLYEIKGELSVKDEPANVNAVTMYESLLCKISIHAFLNHQFLVEVRDYFSAVVI